MATFRRCLCRVKQWPPLSNISRSIQSAVSNENILKNSRTFELKYRWQSAEISKRCFTTECEHSKCWNCGAELQKEETFFCNCGVVQIIPREQEIAESQSSFINKAYTTLLKPLSRGLYLLELKGDPLEETNSSVDPEFLMEIMEVNEDLADADGNPDALEELDNINNKRINKCISDISKLFSEENVTGAKACLIRLRYFTNIQEKIKEMYRKNM